MHRMDEATARDRQSILLLEEGGDLAVRHAELFIENDGERDGLRPQLCGRRTERIRRLERMPALDATPASVTPADVDLKGTDHDTRHRQLFLVLRGDTGLHEVIATARTARRKTIADISGVQVNGMGVLRPARRPQRPQGRLATPTTRRSCLPPMPCQSRKVSGGASAALGASGGVA